MKSIRYVVQFEGLTKSTYKGAALLEEQVIDRGYYARHQPHYHWSFTEDLEKAYLYKSLKGASDRYHYAKGLFDAIGVRISIKKVRIVQKLEFEDKDVKPAPKKIGEVHVDANAAQLISELQGG